MLRVTELEFGKNLEMLVFEEKGKLKYPEENLSEQGREPKTTRLRIEPRPHYLVGGECSHHCAIPAGSPKEKTYHGILVNPKHKTNKQINH